MWLSMASDFPWDAVWPWDKIVGCQKLNNNNNNFLESHPELFPYPELQLSTIASL